MSSKDDDTRILTAADVLRRYVDDGLPAFCGVVLDDVNTRGIFGEYPLDVAATRGSLEEVRALLDAGANIHARGELGNTALHEAVVQGHMDVVRFLLQRGASRTARNDDGHTPAALAKLGGRDDIAYLVEKAGE